jgi:hypothetical protein
LIDQISDELNSLFGDSLKVNTSILAKVENNAITLYLEITFESPNVTSEMISQLCQYLKGQIQPVSDRQFKQCVLPSGTKYYPGNTVTMSLQSEPEINSHTGGATGLTSSIMLIGFSHLLHHLFKNL